MKQECSVAKVKNVTQVGVSAVERRWVGTGGELGSAVGSRWQILENVYFHYDLFSVRDISFPRGQLAMFSASVLDLSLDEGLRRKRCIKKKHCKLTLTLTLTLLFVWT